jgi:glyoxylase-like metal-dependent hydrolase (beta-lactamase superfamily II)
LALACLAASALTSSAQVAPPSQTEAELILLGTGYPRPDPATAGPATGYPLKDIQAVLLTHLHSDHIAGLPDLFTTS